MLKDEDIQYNNKKSCLYDLYDIYSGSFLVNHKGPIFIDERDVSNPKHDLVHRDNVVNSLLDAIRYCRSSKSFVIGLNGKWGSGKTSIINFVKHILRQGSTTLLNGDFKDIRDFIIIDYNDFDPWVFESSDSLTYGMLETIYKKTISNYRNKDIKAIKNFAKFIGKSGLDLIEDKTKINLRNNINTYNSSYNTLFDFVKFYKNRISDKLQEDGKTAVFFIENIDRTRGDLVVKFMQLLGSILDMENIIYVVSYDREQLNKIFKDNDIVQPLYYEKVINQEIEVKYPDKVYCCSIYQKVIENILKGYGMPHESICKMKSIVDFLGNNVNDLRKFKRIINSVFYKVFYVFDNGDDKKSKLVLELIKFLDYDLYTLLQDNNAYLYIPQEDEKVLKLEHFTSRPSYDKAKASALSNQLNENYKKYKFILCDTFPILKEIYHIGIDNWTL